MSCVIIEMSGAEEWPHPHWTAGAREIPARRRPTMLQVDREIAEREATRLAATHPGSTFVVFEAVAAGITQRVPTHITLGGQVVAERTVARVVKLSKEDGASQGLLQL